jgi:hypothetical protein
VKKKDEDGRKKVQLKVTVKISLFTAMDCFIGLLHDFLVFFSVPNIHDDRLRVPRKAHKTIYILGFTV